jgi:hypothetical protein
MLARSNALEASERSIAASMVFSGRSYRALEGVKSECSHGLQLMFLRSGFGVDELLADDADSMWLAEPELATPKHLHSLSSPRDSCALATPPSTASSSLDPSLTMT